MADYPNIITIACVDPAALNAQRRVRARLPDPQQATVSPVFEIRGVRVRAVLGEYGMLEPALRDGTEPASSQANTRCFATAGVAM